MTSESRFGAVDPGALRRLRDVFLQAEPLVTDHELVDPVNPRFLRVELTDGFGSAERCRFDVRWSVEGWYSVHHTDSADREFRFDRRPKPDSPTAHFHPPPDADGVSASPITVTVPELVAGAVHKLWRNAYEAETVGRLTDADDPP